PDSRGEVLDDDKDHHPRQRCPTPVQEHEILSSRFNPLVHTYLLQVNPQVFCRLCTDRHQAFLASFSFHFNELNIQKEVGNFKADKFAYTQAAAIKHLQHGFVAHALRCRQIYGADQLIDFSDIQYVRDLTSQTRCLDQGRGVLQQSIFKAEE